MSEGGRMRLLASTGCFVMRVSSFVLRKERDIAWRSIGNEISSPDDESALMIFEARSIIGRAVEVWSSEFLVALFVESTARYFGWIRRTCGIVSIQGLNWLVGNNRSASVPSSVSAATIEALTQIESGTNCHRSTALMPQSCTHFDRVKV